MIARTTCPIIVVLLPSLASAQPLKDVPAMSNTATKAGKGVGVVTALDPKAAKVTIRHAAGPGGRLAGHDHDVQGDTARGAPKRACWPVGRVRHADQGRGSG